MRQWYYSTWPLQLTTHTRKFEYLWGIHQSVALEILKCEECEKKKKKKSKEYIRNSGENQEAC